MLRSIKVVIVATAVLSGVIVPLTAAQAETSGVISGRAFEDSNRNGLYDAGEAALADQLIYAYQSGGSASAQARTGTDGRYVLSGLPTGSYLVTYSATSWSPLKNDWVPTTTGSLKPETSVRVEGSTTTADFGWRRIVRSTTLGAPVTKYVSPAGLQVESYNDAVSAREIHDALAQGALGEEQPYVLVRFDYGSSSYCSISSQRSDGTIGSFRAVCFNNWSTWIDQGDWGLSHEYGHAWSSYRDLILQQDGTFASYLQARGLKDDSRVGSSYLWDPAELVAEDYRQLLGAPTASAVQQANREIPPAREVPGLKDFLLGSYSQPRPAAEQPASGPAPAPLALTGVAMSPDPVTKSGTASATLNVPATLTMQVMDSGGGLVRTLRHQMSAPAGTTTAEWDRQTASGRRAPAGGYTLRVVATTADGQTATGTAAFRVK